MRKTSGSLTLFRCTPILRFDHPWGPSHKTYAFDAKKQFVPSKVLDAVSVEKTDNILRFFFGEKPKTHPSEPFPGLWLTHIEGQPLQEASKVFEKDLELARRGEYDTWAHDPWACLALVTLLSRFGRSKFLQDNTSQNTSRAEGFKVCAQAIPFAKQALRNDEWRRDLYRQPHMPFLLDPLFRSECIEDIDECIAQYQRLGLKTQLLLERRAVLQQFGRFPTRNASLDRETTDEEFEWMCAGNSVAE